MSCNQFEKLIPLYVEGDLDGDDMQKVAAHLRGCHGCARLANHYNASQAWLHSLTPPEFENAFYADLQRSVMQEIQSRQSRPGFFQWLAWRWKPAYAVAFLLLILFGAIAFYVQSTKQAPNSNQGETAKQKEDDKPQPEKKPAPQEEQAPQPELRTPEPFNRQQAGNRQPHRVLRNREPNMKLPPMMLEPVVDSQISLKNVNEINAEEMSEFGTYLSSSEEMTRIELQTGDPNIRIIWFAPKTVELPKTITE